MEIMFDDLTEEAQERLLNLAGVSCPEEMNWDTVPVAVVELDEDLLDKEEEEDEEEEDEEELLDDDDDEDYEDDFEDFDD